MTRQLVNLTLDTLDELPKRCRSCVFWELDAASAERACASGDAALEKEAWVSQTLLEWGSCGKLAYDDGVPAGFVLYSPPMWVPRSMDFPTSPISADAVVLMSAHVMPEFSGTGLGRMLIQGVARDVTRRGMRAIEAFGDASSSEQRAGQTGRAGQTARPSERGAERACLAPADFLLAVGFKTVRPHSRFPRLRLDLRTALDWRSDVEFALDQLLASMSPEVTLRPKVKVPALR